MAWLGWMVCGILACGLGIFAMMRQQQMESLRRESLRATQAMVAQQKNELRELDDRLARLEVELGREKAKTVEARLEHDRVRDETDALDNKVAEARRELDTISAEVAGQDPEMGRTAMIRDVKRLESDIRRLRSGVAALKTGTGAGGGQP